MILSKEIEDYIRLHKEDDVRKLALQKSQLPYDLHTYVLQQIAGWQIARKKIPSWTDIDGIQYPPHLSLEQCSSERAAQYKTSLLKKGSSFVDLTGGMGVDFSFMSRKFDSAVYVEPNPQLCQLASNNFPLLNVRAIIKNCMAEEYIKELTWADCVYIDPSRRDEKGCKVVSIADCIPNLEFLKDELLQKTSSLWVKYSPMLDISQALKSLIYVDELHILSLYNECKELLFHLSNKKNISDVKIVCVNLKKEDEECFSFNYAEENQAELIVEDTICKYLYEPNASIMKAGAFKLLTKRFNILKLDKNSHLYTSDEWIENFPGRKFSVVDFCSLNKRELQRILEDCKKANLSVRNFPMTTDQLKSKLKIKDGGDFFLFATTFAGKKIILKTKSMG